MRIYLITNHVNGKQYVGQTKTTIQKRFSRHCWVSESKKNMPIVLAIKKYGKENFSIKELCECSSQEELDSQEVFFAKKHNTFAPNGYNLKAGKGPHTMSQKTKDKIRKANLGKKASEETRRRLSESHKGKGLSDAAKTKLSNYWKGKQPCKLAQNNSVKACAKTYTMLSPQGQLTVIHNMRQFCLANNLSPQKMCCVVKRSAKSHKGWKLPTSL